MELIKGDICTHMNFGEKEYRMTMAKTGKNLEFFSNKKNENFHIIEILTSAKLWVITVTLFSFHQHILTHINNLWKNSQSTQDEWYFCEL